MITIATIHIEQNYICVYLYTIYVSHTRSARILQNMWTGTNPKKVTL